VNVLRDMPYLVVAVPLAIAAVLALGLRAWGRSAPWLALVGPLVAAAVGAASLDGGSSGSMRWLAAGSSVLTLGYRVDGLSAIMLLVVGVVAACVIVFSIGYMHGDRGYVRYFALLSLFTAAMSGLVIASDLVGIFIGWELVGVCSFLLIGFWYEKSAAAEAARKAFMVTRVGDAAMLVGLAVLWHATGTLDVATILAGAGSLAPAAVTAAAICLLLGAVGKSAQFPLHIWLPDAMEGPTPVSALIHAATMVAAGVFLVARMWPLFALSPEARMVALVLGTITALGAATVALAQTDIKKVLAYSTISQLGFMFAALGVGAWPVAIFHLVTHAAFKALLFLTSGSVIHGSGTQDLREMGGLRSKMPVTATAWVIGGLALAGIPPLAGFFSKDAVVGSVLAAAPWAGIALLAASLLTGAYVARATRLAFFGTSRGAEGAHESPWTMTVPLAVLAAFALALGAAGPAITRVLGAASEPLSLPLAALAVGLAAAGALGGWLLAAEGGAREAAFTPALARAWGAARDAYRFDSLVTNVVTRPMSALARFTDAVLDRRGIDGIAEGLAELARNVGGLLTRMMNGDGQTYSGLLAAGAIVLVCLTIWLVR
jgi:NADH-quinone oxidoreductase subunit L